jgi:hypothetical protein
MKKVFLGLVLALGFMGCKETETDKVADAQFCIDQATAANVGECVAKVAGIETRAAYVIRCTAKFVEEGYTEGDKIFLALEQLDNASSSDQGPAMMTVLAFTAAGTSNSTQWDLNISNASLAVSYCKQAQLDTLLSIATIAATASVAGKFGSLASAGDVKAALATASSDPAAQLVIGNAVIASYEANCKGEEASAPGNTCAQFDAAIAAQGGNPSSVGQFVASCYSNPAQAGCEAFR